MTTKRRTQTNIHTFSARKEAFLYFLAGVEPWIVAEQIGLPLSSAQRYYTSWRKLPPGLDQNLATTRAIWRRMQDKEKMALAKVLSGKMGYNPQDFRARMGRPWALRDLLTGKWLNWQVSGATKSPTGVPSPAHGLQKLMQPDSVKRILELISWSPYTNEGQARKKVQRSGGTVTGDKHDQ